MTSSGSADLERRERGKPAAGSRELVEEPGHVEAAVHRGVRFEPPYPLFELALAAHAVPARALVPGDRNVNEPLEEVPLGRDAGPPRDLELLVRLEVGSGCEVLEPTRVAFLDAVRTPQRAFT